MCPWLIKIGRDPPSLKVVRPLDASKLPPYAAVNYVISDTGYSLIDWRSHLSGGGINASLITTGRSGHRRSYLSSSLTFKLTDPSVLHNSWSNLKGFYKINTQDILVFLYEKFILKVHDMVNKVFIYLWPDLMFRRLIHQSLAVKYIKY